GESQFRVVSSEYFRALRIPLLAGRFFSEGDDKGNKPVAIVSEGLARQWWPNQSPLGKMVAMGGELGGQFSDVPREVIGMVADVRESGLEKLPPPTVFVTPKQAPDQGCIHFFGPAPLLCLFDRRFWGFCPAADRSGLIRDPELSANSTYEGDCHASSRRGQEITRDRFDR